MSISIKPSHRGLFTAKAKKAGVSVGQLATNVLAYGSQAAAATKKQAVFAQNAKKWRKS